MARLRGVGAYSGSKSGPAKMNDDQHKPQKQSVISRIGKFLDLDPITLILMFKSAIPPTIALAIYQNKKVSEVYGVVGYLLPIAAFLGFAGLPRAKFVQNMLAHLFGMCVIASVSMLGLWSATQARKNTTPPGQPLTGYNSSQSAVCGVWLFFLIFIVASIRSARPVLQFPTIANSVFIAVSFSTSGPNLGTPAAARAFIRLLLLTFLTGFGIATAVNLFVVPINARMPVFKQMAGFMGLGRGLLKAVSAYLRSIEGGLEKSAPEHRAALTKMTFKLKTLYTKITVDIGPAKKEVAWGKFDAEDIDDIFNQMREAIPAMMGLASLPNVVDNLPDVDGAPGADDIGGVTDMFTTPSTESQSGTIQFSVADELHNIAGAVATAAIAALDLLDEGLEHVLLVLQLEKPKKVGQSSGPNEDVEAKAEAVRPGDDGFAVYFEQKSRKLYDERRVILKERYHARIPLPEIPSFDEPKKESNDFDNPYNESSRIAVNRQNQLVFVLYLEWFIDAANQALMSFIRFADGKKKDGTTSKSRFIFPGQKHILELFTKPLMRHTHGDQDLTFAEIQPDLGLHKSQIAQKQNPERLQPANKWQVFGDNFSKVSQLLRSPHAAFGFRTACAVLTIAIACLLKDSHSFAAKQRFLWAEMTIAIGMVRTAGLGAYHLILRSAGTTIAMVGCYVVWYMVDGHPAGVIVFAYIFYAMLFWIIFKRPQYVISGMLAVVATSLILGYELQVQRLGLKAALASGQDYYPTYELAPMRLAAVLVGLLVCFFWTVFPYPISEHSEVRKDLSAALFLLSNHYAVTREIIHVGLAAESATGASKKKIHDVLEKHRFKFWTQENQLLGRIRINLEMQRWQLSFGSRFPEKIYEALTNHTETIMNYSALLASASRSLALDGEDEDLKRLVESAPLTSHLFGSRVSLLSNCLGNGLQLPPHLEPLAKDEEEKRLEKTHALTEDTVGKPGYAAVVVLQVASRTILAEIDQTTELVKSLVGELNFTYKLE